MIEPFLIGLAVNLAYDVAKRGRDAFENQTHLLQSVQDAAASSAESFSGITEEELYAVFAEELEDEDLLEILSQDREEIIDSLARNLERRDSVPSDKDCENVISDYLESIESELLSHQRPQEAFSILLRYSRESQADHEEFRKQLNKILSEFEPDLQRLSQRSDRMFPDESQYTLPESEIVLERHEQEEIRDKLSESSNVLVHGEAGVGKSGVVAQTANQLREEEKTVYYLDAREFSSINTAGDLEADLGLSNRFESVLQTVAENTTGCILIIDQLDNVRGTNAGNVFQNLILDCTRMRNVNLLSVCRDWELGQEEYAQINENESIEKVEVGNLNEDEIVGVLKNLGVTEEDTTNEIIDLGENLLNLSLLSSVVGQSENGNPLENVKSEVSLWEEYIESLRREATTGDRSGDLTPDEVIDRAISHSRSSLREATSTFSTDRGNTADDRLRSRGVIDKVRKRKHRFHHEQLQTFFYAWDANEQEKFATDILNDGIDDRVAADVLVWLAKLYSESESERDRLLTGLLRDSIGTHSSVGYYAQAVLVDAISEMNPSRIGDSSFSVLVDALDRDYQLRNEFFRNCDNIRWAEKFIETETVEKISGPGIGYIGQFSDEAPKVVVQSMEAVQAVDNRVVMDYSRVIINLSGEEASEASNILSEWLADVQVENIPAIAQDLTSLFTQLVEDDQVEAATILIGEILDSKPPEPEESTRYDEDTEVPERFQLKNTEANSRLDIHWLEEILPLITNLAGNAGQPLVEMINEKLHKALKYEAECYDSIEPADVAKPRKIETSSLPRASFKDILINALLNAMEGWIQTEKSASALSQIQGFLSEGGIYRRLALYVLSEHPEGFPDIIRTELLSAENYQNPSIRHEFFFLLKSGFPELPSEEQCNILNIILRGPGDDYKESLKESRFEDPTCDEADIFATQAAERWRRDRLWMIRSHLPERTSSVLTAFLDRHGEPEEPTVMGSVSTPSLEEEKTPLNKYLEELTASEFIDSCISGATQLSVPEEMEPEAEHLDDQFLSRKLRDRFSNRANEYIDYLPKLSDCENSIYLQQALGGIDMALCHDDVSITNQEPLVATIVGITDDIEEQDADLLDELSILIRDFVGYEGSEFPIEKYSEELEDMLLSLLFWEGKNQSESSIDSLIEKFDDTAAVSPSTIRSRAFDSIMRYIRIRLPDSYTGESDTELGELGDLFEEVTEIFSEPDTDLRIAMGVHLDSIWHLDPESFSEHLENLLPIDDDLERFLPVWYGYSVASYVILPAFEKLESRYYHVARQLNSDFGEQIANSKLGRSLSQYLACAYTNDVLTSPDNDLIVTTLQNEPEGISCLSSGYADYFYQRIGDTGASDERQQIWSKTEAFWHWRVDNTEITEMDENEVTNYIQCLQDYSIVEIEEVKELIIRSIGGLSSTGHGSRALESYLASQASNNQVTVMDIYLKLLTQQLDSDTPLYFSDDCWEIVSTAVKHPESREKGLEAAEKIFEQGNPEYRKLLDQYSQSER